MSWGIRQESNRHKAERAEREAVKRLVRERDRTCQAAPRVGTVASAPQRCGGPLDVHEIIPRSAWRKGYLVVDNGLLVCRVHHDWIDDHPDDAHAVGLHGYSHERPSE